MDRKQVTQLSLFAIAWPIFIESALQMFLRTSDTFMLSRVSDETVAAVGVANQIIMFAMLIFNFVSIGSAVVVSQYLGAGKHREIGKLASSSLALNFLFGVVISLLVVSFSGSLLHIFHLDPKLFRQAQTFLYITGGMLFIQALLTATIAVIQAHGFTRHTMLAAIGMNVLNMTGNFLVIYGPFGFPKLGMIGVAMSTVFAQCAGLIFNLYVLRKVAEVRLFWKHMIEWQRGHIKQVLQIGIPSSIVSLSYSVNQLVTTAFISTLGAEMLTTRIYTQNIMYIATILAISLGRGVQIIVGHLAGAGEQDEAYRQVFLNLRRSMLITLSAVAVICLFRVPLLGIFTDDPKIVSIGAALLLLGFILEPGRNFNIIIEKSLQAAGDAHSAMLVSIIVTWTVSVPLTYFLGIHMGYGLYGIWAAFVVDEWLRGILLCLRWKSRAWARKALVRHGKEAAM